MDVRHKRWRNSRGAAVRVINILLGVWRNVAKTGLGLGGFGEEPVLTAMPSSA
jgi:hypothetical protein